ncbi:MAG: hypothetical protein F6K56_41680 [Moorea sp. SIO3G5]|nr:hypothetical protein [Moorena sp. SIO3G5]
MPVPSTGSNSKNEITPSWLNSGNGIQTQGDVPQNVSKPEHLETENIVKWLTLPARLWTGILAWPMATLREQRGDLFNQPGAWKNRGLLSTSDLVYD